MKNSTSGFVNNNSGGGLAGLSGFNPGDRTLRLQNPYMQGQDVRYLQQQLVAAGFTLPQFGVDGKFGLETQAAVKQYQQSKGYAVADGSVGNALWKELKTGSGSGQSSGGSGFSLPSFEQINRSLNRAWDITDDDADTDWFWMPDEQYDKSGDIVYKEESGSSNNNLGWWLGGGAVAISLLGIALAAGGDSK